MDSLKVDDYITKPFSVKLVLMRVEAVLRRVKEREGQEATTTLSYRDFLEQQLTHNRRSLTETEILDIQNRCEQLYDLCGE